MLEGTQHAPAVGLSPRQRADYEEWFQFFITWGSSEADARDRALRQAGGGDYPLLAGPELNRPPARSAFYPPRPRAAGGR